MSSKHSHSLLVRGLRRWLGCLGAGAPARRPVRPRVEELERRDTPSAPFLVKDIHPGDPGSYPTSIANVSSTLFFAANDGSHGQELWKSNGTSAGTALVKDIYPGPADSDPTFLTNVVGTLFFAANNGSHG
jgi:ELWxxDGT repeat protein